MPRSHFKAAKRGQSRASGFVYRYPRPMLTADAVVLAKCKGRLCVLLVKRKNHPYKGYWALPGGYVNENEQALEAARRELAEETHLKQVKLRQIGFFDTPGRDPRGWTVSVVHLGYVSANKLKELRAGDDTAEVALHPLRTRIKLAFDHIDIIRYAARWWKDNQK